MEAAKPATSHSSGTVVIMSPGDRPWNGDSASSKAEAAPTEPASGKRRIAAMAAVVALATVAGALGGALATAGLGHMTAVSPAAANTSTLEASVARIDADIAALKASVEHTSKVGTGQFNKTSDRLDKVEKAQAEPAAKLAKLSEAVDKLRAASVRLQSGCRRAGCREGRHGIGRAARDRGGSRDIRACRSAQARSRQAADGRRLGAA